MQQHFRMPTQSGSRTSGKPALIGSVKVGLFSNGIVKERKWNGAHVIGFGTNEIGSESGIRQWNKIKK